MVTSCHKGCITETQSAQRRHKKPEVESEKRECQGFSSPEVVVGAKYFGKPDVVTERGKGHYTDALKKDAL